MKKILIIFFLYTQLVCQAEYTRTFELSISQKYAIPEDVSSGDDVGIWQKTVTWSPVGTVYYSIEENFNNAFAIDATSGLITIADASKINGKIQQSDVLINLIIRTTDSGVGFELDTAKIWVKENSYCKFIDYGYTGIEAGTRSQPYNDLSDATFTSGWGYFIKRGNKPENKSYKKNGVPSTQDNPMIIGAYGSGNNPEFNGSSLVSEDALIIFLNTPAYFSHCFIYNIDVKNYPEQAFRVYTNSSYMGFYNCKFKSNIQIGYQGDLADIYFYGIPQDSLVSKHNEVINLESSGSFGPIIKTDATGLNAYNIKSAAGSAPPPYSAVKNFRIASMSNLSHFVFIGAARSLQARYPHTVITDGIIINSKEGGIFMVTDATYNGHPDRLILKNILFKECEYGIYAYNTEMNKITIEDCRFEANTNDGIYFRNGGRNWTIQRSSFINNGGDGLDFNNASQASTGTQLNHNLFYGNGGMGIRATASACANNMSMFNNTVDEEIDCSGAQLVEARNNYFRSLVNATTASNNLDIDTIDVSKHFRNYAAFDYRLKSTAFSAIDKGFLVSFTSDMAGTLVPQGAAADIGAYEYKGWVTSNQVIQINNQKEMTLFPNPTTGIVHIRFDNFTGNTHQNEWLRITDLSGCIVFHKPVDTFFKDGQGEINLSGLHKGFYMVYSGNRIMGKLVLQ